MHEHEPRIPPPPILLLAAACEACLLTFVGAYLATYAHLVLHASDELSALSLGIPSAAVFVGSTLWGQVAQRWHLRPLVPIGLASYALFGAAIFIAHSAIVLIVLLAIATIGTSALRPATAAYVTSAGGAVGWRLGVLLRWQSAGWLLGGLLSGTILERSLGIYPWLLLTLGLGMGVLAFVALRRLPDAVVAQHEQGPATERSLALPAAAWPILISFFFVYAGYEGYFATFGLYVTGAHLPISLVGYGTSVSTILGWVASGKAGALTDRTSGRTLYLGVMGLMLASFGIATWLQVPLVGLIVFCLPSFALLQIAVQRSLAEVTAERLHGKAMGAYNALTGVGTTIGAAICGGVEQRFGTLHAPASALALGASGIVLYALLTPLLRRRVQAIRNTAVPS